MSGLRTSARRLRRSSVRVVVGGALLGMVLLLAACAGERATGPSDAGPARVQVAAAFQTGPADGGGIRAAYEATDSVRVELVRLPDETQIVDRFLDFDPSAPSTEISLRVSLRDEAEDFVFNMWLVAEDELIFFGSASLTLEAGKTTTVDVTLEPIPDRLGLPAETPTLTALGDTLQLEGAVLFATGDTIPDAVPTWSGLDPEVATVSPDGEVVAVSEGEARIVASYGGLRDTLTVTVEQVVDRVIVEPGFASVFEGQSVQFSATVEDANGNVMTDRTVTWSSSDRSIATVDQTGVATGIQAGTVSIRAEVEGVVGGATLEVRLG